MKTQNIVFLGIKGSIIALDRFTGQQLWATHLKGSGFVNILVQEDRILATCYGEVFCLDPYNGKGLWHNPLKGFGLGLASIAVQGSAGDQNLAAMVEQHHRDQERSSSESSAGATC